MLDRAIHLPPTLGFAPRRLEEGEFSPTSVKGYKLFPDEGSIRFAQGDDSQAWGNEDNELVLTEGKQNYFANAKELRENNLTALTPEWSPSWFEGMDKPIKVKEGGKETETAVISYVREHLEAVSDWNAEGLKHSRLLPLVAHG